MKAIEPGVYDDLPANDYHADDAIGHSDCMTLMDESPAKWRWNRFNPEPPKRTFDIGTAAHAMLLEPNTFEHKFAILPSAFESYRKSEAQALAAAARLRDMIPLLATEFEAVIAMVDAVRADPVAGKLLRSGNAEQSYFWRDDTTGMMRKCRPDFNWMGNVVNFKTAASAHPREIARAAWNNHWWSSQWYTVEGMMAHGITLPTYHYIVVEKEPPHPVVVYKLPERVVEMGRIWTRKAIDTFAACAVSGEYPGYADQIIELEMPRWAEVQFEDDNVSGRFALREA